MRKLLWIGAFSAALVLGACAQDAVEPDEDEDLDEPIEDNVEEAEDSQDEAED